MTEEVRLDLNNGLFGKTAIHPNQIAQIEAGFKVAAGDFEEATHILAPEAKAVFRMGDRMCEPATHSRWARDIRIRADIYGICGDNTDQHHAA